MFRQHANISELSSETKVKFGMSSRLVMIRHGESRTNVINKAIKKVLLKTAPKKFQETPDRELRLSRQGVAQAEATDKRLRREYPRGFDVIYLSDHFRAKEAVAPICIAAGWRDAKIRVVPLVGERNWAHF